MPLEKGFHFPSELLAKQAPVAIIFGVNEQRGNQIDILNIQLTARSDQKIGSTIFERKLWVANSLPVPPREVSVEIALRIV